MTYYPPYSPYAAPNTPGGASYFNNVQSSQVQPTDNGGGLLGNNTNPGFLGTGQYVAPAFNIQYPAFDNPNYTPGAYQAAAQNYLGATTGPIQAQGTGGNNAALFNAGTQGQLGLAQQYANMAAGRGPSLANVTAQQQGAANLAGTESMLGSARGAGNPAAAQMAARNAQAMGAQGVAQNATLGRTQEELGAMGAQGGLLGNVASMGQGNLQFNAGQANQIAQSSQANRLAAYTNYLNNLGEQGVQQQQGQIQGQQLGVQQQLGLDAIQQRAYEDAAKNNSKLSGSLLSGLSGIMGVKS